MTSTSAVEKGKLVAGFALLGLVGFPYLFSGLVVPPAAALALIAAWAALFVVAVVNRGRPNVVLAVPFAAAAVWVAVVSAGSLLFDWTA